MYNSNSKNSSQELIPAVNWIPYDAQYAARMGTKPDTGAGTLNNLFSKFKNWKGRGVPEGFGWSKGSGLEMFGKNVGKGANIASGVLQGAQALKGVSDYNKAKQSNDDMLNDIVISAASNPLLSSYLTSDQMRLVNDIRRGNYETSSDVDDFLRGVGGGLGDIFTSAALGAAGGIPGMVIGGLGAAANAGIRGLSSGTEEESAELAALYQALMDAEAQYKSMKRPNFTGLGIQQQYQNMYA